MSGAHDITALDMEQGDLIHYAPPGACIYCGADDVTLTDEHIVPFALGGNTVIFRKASCVPCQKAIHPYETRVLSRALGRIRHQLDSPSRNRKKRPETISHEFVLFDSETHWPVKIVRRELTWQNSIVTHTGWTAPPPGLLDGRPPTTLIEGRPWHLQDSERAAWHIEALAAETGHSGPIAFKVGDVYQADLLRFMAKTAHAIAVATLGRDAFEPMLADIILGRSNTLTHLVGGFGGPSPPAGADAETFELDVGSIEDRGHRFIVVRLRLYGMLGTPEHLVVVGRQRAEPVPGRPQ